MTDHVIDDRYYSNPISYSWPFNTVGQKDVEGVGRPPLFPNPPDNLKLYFCPVKPKDFANYKEIKRDFFEIELLKTREEDFDLALSHLWSLWKDALRLHAHPVSLWLVATRAAPDLYGLAGGRFHRDGYLFIQDAVTDLCELHCRQFLRWCI